MHSLRKKGADIILLSDTRISKDIEALVKTEWGGHVNFASFTSQARGVAIFFKKELAIQIIENSIYNDPSGNLTILNFLYETYTITLGCIYGPNQDNPEFYKEIVFPKLEKCQENSDFTIIGGDWNIALSQEMDTYGYTQANNEKARHLVIEHMDKDCLVDIFRETYPSKKRYSWRQFGGNKRSRLDYFLISRSLLPYIESSDILPGVHSDHSIISVEIDFSKFKRGKGFFKFNNSLNRDKEYVDLIHNTIKDTVRLYAEDVYDQNFFQIATPEQLQNVILTINPQLFLESLLLEIRGKTIGYCAWKKKINQEKQTMVLHRLEVLEMLSDRHPLDEDIKRQVQQTREEVDRFIEEESEAARCRARINWQLEGEKPSKYFCNLEKHNAAQKYIPTLKVEDRNGASKVISKQSDIEYEIYEYYQKLYKSQENQIASQSIDTFLCEEGRNKPHLNDAQRNGQEGLITIQEITKYIKTCRADASPGSSGFTGGFFKMFWRNLKIFILNSLNYAFDSGSLSVTQKLGVIILLPKPEKDKQRLGNWRPISLLNTTYKMLSGALAERLKRVLPSIIHEDQKGFVSGRYIGECIRNTYDIIEYANSHNIAGLILAIDFEKAFDSIAHSFILKTLKYFGFGPDFVRWISILLNGIESCVNHCGNVSARFEVGRSCRQGDPISPYLFILCVEILAIKIRMSKAVGGIKFGDIVKKLDFYADDLTAYLNGSEGSLRALINILDDFHLLSGLKINLSKCKAVWIGNRRFENRIICSDLKIIWSNKFRLLGINFDADLSKMDTNFVDKIEEIKKLYKSWLYRSLTPIGRITVIKSMAIPKLSHVALVCPHMEGQILQDVETLSYKFLWKDKPDRVKRKHATLPYSKGGLNMPDIGKFWDGLKMAWIRRIQGSKDVWWKILQLNLLQLNHETFDVWYGGPDRLRNISNKLSNRFWAETFKIAGNILEEIPFAHPHLFYHLNILDNDLFATNNVPLRKNEFRILWSKGLIQIAEFFDTNNIPPRLLTLEELNSKHNIKLDFLSYHRIKTAIELGSKRLSHKTTNFDLSDIRAPRQPVLFKVCNLKSVGCKIFYQTLKARDFMMNSTEAAETKWHNSINMTFSIKFWDDCWKLIRNKYIDNKTRWIQYQIIRYILPTNYSVSKYNPNQNPSCTFCHFNSHLEQLPYLFWECPKVKQFWLNVETFLQVFQFNFKLNLRKAIFGATEANDEVNAILLWSKRFIWVQKFTSKKLETAAFYDFIRHKIELHMMVAQEKESLDKFLKGWGKIVEFLGIGVLPKLAIQ